MRLLLVLMVVIWGANYSLIKVVLRELPPPVFNALRLLVASGVFRILLAFMARTRPTRRDWIQLAGLGLYGQFLYQLFFLNGMSRTSVANASLIVGLVPLVVALTNAAMGLERLSRAYWIGIAVSVVGMYFVVGLDAGMSTTSLVGDALTFGAVLAWSAYTVAAKPLLTRHSPLVVTGWSMALGTVFYLPYAMPDMLALDWRRLEPAPGSAPPFSALLALNLSYVLWNTAVQRIGSSQTAIYSNLIPVAAVGTAAVWLHEPIDRWKAIGAALIVAGLVAATRRRKRPTRSRPKSSWISRRRRAAARRRRSRSSEEYRPWALPPAPYASVGGMVMRRMPPTSMPEVPISKPGMAPFVPCRNWDRAGALKKLATPAAPCRVIEVEVVSDRKLAAAGGLGARTDGQVLDDEVGRALGRRRRSVGVVVCCRRKR